MNIEEELAVIEEVNEDKAHRRGISRTPSRGDFKNKLKSQLTLSIKETKIPRVKPCQPGQPVRPMQIKRVYLPMYPEKGTSC